MISTAGSYETFAHRKDPCVGATWAALWFTGAVLRSLVTRRSATTLPIVPLDSTTLPKWRRSQPKPIRAWLDANGFEATGNRPLLIPGPKGAALALLGRTEESPWTWASAAQRLPAGRYIIDAELEPKQATEAAIGWALASYAYDEHRSSPREIDRKLVWPKGADRAEAKRQIEAIGWVRDLINTPAGQLGPSELVEAARSIRGARVRAIKGRRLAEGFPAVAAVGGGSARAPQLIDLRWGDTQHPRLTLVGKGVCFDSGGLNVKSASGMLRMKKDMGGAALLLGLARMIVDRGLPVRLRLLIPAVENLAGPQAYRPGDVIRTRAGKSVEITNTDAEGRVILADALAAASDESPDLLIDAATLTGSARSAVGAELVPFWTRSATLAEALVKAGRSAREPVWQLPLHSPYRRHLDSRIADLKNAASTHQAGASIAALFLREFVEAPERWIHLDVFGWNAASRPGRPAGGEATGLRALWALLGDRYGD